MGLFGMFGRQAPSPYDEQLRMTPPSWSEGAGQPSWGANAAGAYGDLQAQPAAPTRARYDWGSHLQLLGAGLRDLDGGGNSMGTLRQTIIQQRADMAKRAAIQKAVDAARSSADPRAALYDAFSKDPLLADQALQFLPKDRTPMSVAEGSQVIDPDNIDPATGRAKVLFEGAPKNDAPTGYQWVDPADKSKGMHFVQGGPGDPKQAHSLAESRHITLNIGGPGAFTPPPAGSKVPVPKGLTPEGFDSLARTYWKDPSAKLPALGVGAAGVAAKMAIANRAAELATQAGETGQATVIARAKIGEAKKGLQELGVRRARTGQAEHLANANLDLAEQAIAAVPRFGSPWVNKPLQTFQEGTGDPRITRAKNAIETFIPEYAKVMSGGNPQLSDQAVNHAHQLLYLAQGPAQAAAAVKQLRAEMANQGPSYDKEESQLLDALGGADASPAPAAPTAAPQQFHYDAQGNRIK